MYVCIYLSLSLYIYINATDIQSVYMYNVNIYTRKKIFIKINMATNEGNSQNEMQHRTNNEIVVDVQSCLWLQVDFMAW